MLAKTIHVKILAHSFGNFSTVSNVSDMQVWIKNVEPHFEGVNVDPTAYVMMKLNITRRIVRFT